MEEKRICRGSLSESLDELSLCSQQDLSADINAQDKSGDTCLHRAIEESREGVVEALLSKNIDIEIKNEEGETALMVAVRLRNEVMVKKLINEGANVDPEDIHCNTPLLEAVMLNLEHIVDVLLKSGASCLVENEFYKTPLHVASTMNFESILDKLLKAGADVNVVNSKNETPLQLALSAGNLKIAKKLLSNGAFLDPVCVFSSLLNCYERNFCILFDFILENGCDLNIEGCENWSLLHLAVIKSSAQVVDVLLKKEANVNAKDNSGETPLHFAARLSNTAIVKLLLKHNCDVNAKNIKGQTALFVAIQNFSKEVVRLLLNAGADISQSVGRIFLDFYFPLGPIKKSICYILSARKMELAKVRVNVTQNDGTLPKNFTTLCAFEARCLEELEKIKAVNFSGISLYNIFSECRDPVYASNFDLTVFVNSVILKSDFPLYAGILKRMFKEGTKRNILLDELSGSIRLGEFLNVTHIVLPNEISRKIFVNLEDCDLLNVKRAFNINNKQQIKLGIL